MYVFVTGGSGFVGSWIVRELVAQGKKVIVYDLKPITTNPFLQDISDNIIFVRGSILDYPHLVNTFHEFGNRTEGIIHTAGVIAYQTTANPHYSVMVNTVGSLNILEVARIFGVNKVVCIGSGAVYGEAKGILSEEKTPAHPSDLYGASKFAMELFGIQYTNHYGIDFRSVRLYFVYGPGTIPSQQYKLYTVLFGPLEGLQNLELEKGGDQKVDLTYVKDSANGVLLAYNAKALKHKVFNISGGVAYKISEIAAIVQRYAKAPTNVKIGPGSIISRGSPLDISLAKKILGYEPRYDLEKGISEYSEWLKQSCS